MVANYLECHTLTAPIEPASLSHADSYLGASNLVKLDRARDRPLQLLVFNEKFLVSVSHQLALTTFLPFVHTAHRHYRLNGLVRSSDWSVKLCLNWIGVASDCLTFTLNYWSDDYCNHCT